MSRIYASMEELIGRTPMIELGRMEKALGLEARLLAKLEFRNPAGSAKDRVARSIIRDAEARGVLKEGAVIIEPTSGNTGIGLAAVAVPKGYRVIIVMPETMSMERRLLMKAYGAELVLTDGSAGMAGAIRKAKELAAKIPGSFIAGQFENPANPAAHYTSTGPEIWEDADGEVDIFVAGVGTGGIISGTGRFLKERNPGIRIVAVEPASSSVLSGGQAGSHGIQGIGAGFIPEALDTGIYDQIITVTEEEACRTGRMLVQTEGLLAGISSGAALWAAIRLAREEENRGKTVVTLLPDSGERYLSTPMFAE